MAALRWFMGDTWQDVFARWYVRMLVALLLLAVLRKVA